jgi:GxxExxY protein
VGSATRIEDQLTRQVIDALMTVHHTLGPGFLEAIYQRAPALELAARGLAVATQHEVLVHYRGQLIGKHRLDLVVAQRLVVELKTVEELSKAHYAQVRSYLKATGLPVALLVNFAKEKVDFRRVELNISPQSPLSP